MTDNVVDLHKARRAQEEPSECSDRFGSDDLRPVNLGSLPVDLAPAEIFMAAQQSRKAAESAADLLQMKDEIARLRAGLNTLEAALDKHMEDHLK